MAAAAAHPLTFPAGQPPPCIRITFPAQATELHQQLASLQPGEQADCQEGVASSGQSEMVLGSVERSFVLWFDIFLDSMLQFSFLFWFWVFCFSFFFSFIFPGGGEKEECLRRYVATHLTVFTLANVNEVMYDHII